MGTRILLVEDDDSIADFVVRGLREEGFSVERVRDGGEGDVYLSTQTWDLVLLDWWLPVVDGLSVLRRLRRLDQRTPVLFLTARDAVADRVTGLNEGADDYLCKPFAFEELLARVHALTRRQRSPRELMLRYDDVSADLVTQRVERSGKKLDLTAKEQALLTLFLRHPGEVLSRTRIYEMVWNEHYDGESNTLEVHVKELRRKLEAHGPRLIHTLRHRGYRFGESK